jgi:FkbM family methyltransferase
MTTGQRVLLRALSSKMLGRLGERLLRGKVWRIEAGEGAGLRLRLPQNRDYVVGSSELPVQRALKQYLRPGDVLYDVGANVGFFTLQAARHVGPAGLVCAFEPVPGNVDAIRRNAQLNDLANIRLFQLAVGRKQCMAEFLLTQWDGGGSLCAAAVRQEQVVARATVPVASLDELIPSASLPGPTLVKIDVEGAEMDVLEGMSETIQRFNPILLYEVDDGDPGTLRRRWAALDDLVRGYGYAVHHLESSYPNRGWHVGHSLALPPSFGRTKLESAA